MPSGELDCRAMKRETRVGSALIGVLLAGMGCKGGCSDSSSTKPAPTVSSGSATPASIETLSDEEIFCKDQPYRRRCEKTCKEAQSKAITTSCKDETSAFRAWSESEAAFGKCMLECTRASDDSTCIGAPDKPTCDCQLKCYKALPKDVLLRARTVAHCYHEETKAACQ